MFYLGNTNHKPNVTNLGIKVAELSFKSLGIHFSKDLKQTSEKNLEDRFNKFKTILNIWKSRGLSLKGKVTVLKSVAIPQLLYATSVLYVPDDFITKVDMAISKFIWNDKPPKIKKSTMISRIHEGGLKMPSFEFMVYSQKVMWIKRILSSDQQKWKSIAFKLIGLSEFDLKCKPSVKFIQNKQSVFYEQVLRIWLNFHARNPSKDNICKEIIWNNKFILIDKKIVNTNYIRWKQHGILYVKNLLHDDGTFLDMSELSPKYGLPLDYIKYNSLSNAIPKQWKRDLLIAHLNAACFHNDESDKNNEWKFSINEKQYSLCKLSSQLVYWTFVDRTKKYPTAMDKWLDDLPFLNEVDFQKFYCLPYQIVRCTRLHTFQYKLLNRIISCNENLHRWKIIKSPKCDYCSQVQSIDHLFYTCHVAHTFWSSVQLWFKNKLQISLPLSKTDILFGVPFSTDEILFLLNYIIIHAKWFIYKCKIGASKPELFLFLVELNNSVKDEYVIERIKTIDNDINNKWTLLYDIVVNDA
jgi:hypothetical protein